MLTIGQVAEYVGVTVRAVRHYHRIGLLAEPARDASGYRRYGAAEVIELVRIKALSDAGVPLAKVRQVLTAPTEEFDVHIDRIDAELAAQVKALQARRKRLRQLRSGDRIYLPDDVADFLDLLRQCGISERTVQLERDSWLLWLVVAPDLVTTWIARKREAMSDPAFVQHYRTFDAAVGGDAEALAELQRMSRLVRRDRQVESDLGSHASTLQLSQQHFADHFAVLGIPDALSGYSDVPTDS
ncbi:MerR family transcriptional regulator [Nakamurella aerolata]|uniref:MerR family transcriptional regulator n=1 Tax=Nakamurella aerolata TaxID=1656892 RepID=A0A849A5I2_9ACTN|nr:MerR family transcriptional regulator [Nakamurella aerolata]NNG36244.1 MerR family transcriptional regulator [Nakamurella aerolata]